MLPLVGGLIAGGASLLGSIFSSNTSASNTQAQIAGQEAMQQQSEQFNADQANLNRQFQAGQVQQAEAYNTQMSNTAYQRASQDMTAAGLNPAAMFGSGSAASTPNAPTASGSTASVGTPSVPMSQRQSPLGNLGDVVTKALSTASAVKGFEQQQADIDLRRAQRNETNERALSTGVDVINKGLEQDLITANTAGKQMDNIVKQVGVTTAKNIESGINPDVRKAGDIASFGASKVAPVADLAGTLVSSALHAKKFMPQRSTTETSRDPSTGDTFSERFNY